MATDNPELKTVHSVFNGVMTLQARLGKSSVVVHGLRLSASQRNAIIGQANVIRTLSREDVWMVEYALTHKFEPLYMTFWGGDADVRRHDLTMLFVNVLLDGDD